MNNNGCILNNHSELGYRTKHGPALLISSQGWDTLQELVDRGLTTKVDPGTTRLLGPLGHRRCAHTRGEVVSH